jgi:hypothetical protein
MNYVFKINPARSKIFSLSLTSVKMNLAVDFTNKADIDLIVSGYNLNLLLNGHGVSNIVSSDTQLVKANSISPFNIGIEFNPTQVFANNKAQLLRLGNDLLTNKNNIVFTLTGTVSGAALGITDKNIPVSMNFTLADLTA